ANIHGALEELGAAHLWHALVGHDDGHVGSRQELQPARAALRGEDVELLPVVEAEGPQDVRLVIDDEHGIVVVVDGHGAASYPPALATLSRDLCPAGMLISTVAPAPGVLSTSMRPPCAVTTWWLIASPRPVPRPTSFVVKNGSKMWSRTSGTMPGPSSRMRTSTTSPSHRVVIQMFPRSRTASQAFASTFMKTWFIFPGSRATSGKSP